MKNVIGRLRRVQGQRILQRRKMSRADDVEHLEGQARSVRADKANLPQRLQVHYLAVSPLAH